MRTPGIVWLGRRIVAALRTGRTRIERLATGGLDWFVSIFPLFGLALLLGCGTRSAERVTMGPDVLRFDNRTGGEPVTIFVTIPAGESVEVRRIRGTP